MHYLLLHKEYLLCNMVLKQLYELTLVPLLTCGTIEARTHLQRGDIHWHCTFETDHLSMENIE